jgi:hypothetical protein
LGWTLLVVAAGFVLTGGEAGTAGGGAAGGGVAGVVLSALDDGAGSGAAGALVEGSGVGVPGGAVASLDETVPDGDESGTGSAPDGAASAIIAVTVATAAVTPNAAPCPRRRALGPAIARSTDPPARCRPA